MPDTTLAEDLAELKRLKDRATQLNREAKDAAKERDLWELHCLERMEAEEQDSTRSRGYLYSCVRDKHYAKVQDREEFVEWAQDNAPHLIRLVENKEQLNSLVKQLLDDGAEFPPGLGWYDDNYISVRKAT
jgi:tRNA U55 pseudouridine synthase TruB